MLVDDSGGNLAKSSRISRGNIEFVCASCALVRSGRMAFYGRHRSHVCHIHLRLYRRTKGVVTPHRAVMDYIEAFFRRRADFEDDVFGNQAPLDYVAAIRDIYLPLYTGALNRFTAEKAVYYAGKAVFAS